jgi:hypothetical protein
MLLLLEILLGLVPVIVEKIPEIGIHIMGHQANKTLEKGVGTIFRSLHQERKLNNHDLQKALLRSFLGAMRMLTIECHEQLKNISANKPVKNIPANKQDFQWLDRQYKHLNKQLKKIEQNGFDEREFQRLNLDDSSAKFKEFIDLLQSSPQSLLLTDGKQAKEYNKILGEILLEAAEAALHQTANSNSVEKFQDSEGSINKITNWFPLRSRWVKLNIKWLPLKPLHGLKSILSLIAPTYLSTPPEDANYIPQIWKDKLKEELFEELCNHFAYEIKHNQVVCNFFQSQLLAKIDETLEEQNSKLQNIERLLMSPNILAYQDTSSTKIVINLSISIDQLDLNKLNQITQTLRQLSGGGS